MRFVLVHGAWFGGWTWDRRRPELESRGHEVSAPDLSCDTVGLTQDDCAAPIGPQPDAVTSASPRDVVIVCRRDAAVDPASFARLRLGVVELDAGHFPMLTHPREPADALEELALVRPAGEADERPRGDP